MPYSVYRRRNQKPNFYSIQFRLVGSPFVLVSIDTKCTELEPWAGFGSRMTKESVEPMLTMFECKRMGMLRIIRKPMKPRGRAVIACYPVFHVCSHRSFIRCSKPVKYCASGEFAVSFQKSHCPPSSRLELWHMSECYSGGGH